MGFWRTVVRDLWRCRWVVVVVLALGAAHWITTGLSWALLGWLGLLACLSTAFRKWCWRQAGSPLLLGIIAALAAIFLIETYLGVSSTIFGTFDPSVDPARQTIFLERPLIWLLARLYDERPRQYVEAGLAIWPIVAVIYLGLHLRRHHRHSATATSGGWTERLERGVELLRKCLECASGFLLVSGSLVFANAVNLNATGLNAFATLYSLEARTLGTNTAAIDRLRRQLASLKDLDDALARTPPSKNAQQFLDATTALIDALWNLEQAEEELSWINEVSYLPTPNPLPQFRVPLETTGPEPGETEIWMKILLRIGSFIAIQEKANAAQRSAAALARAREEALVGLAGSIRVVLASARKLTPPEKARLLEAIAARLAALVAHDGIERATREIRDLTSQARQQALAQQHFDKLRSADVAEYRQALQDYMAQQKACVDVAYAVSYFLANDPDGTRLVSRLNKYRSAAGKPHANGGNGGLLARPRWKTPSPFNDALREKFTREVSQHLFHQPNPPGDVLEGFGSELRGGFGKAGGNLEAAGFRLLREWVTDDCRQGRSPAAVIAELRLRAH